MENFFQDVARTAAEIHFQYTEQFVTALLPMTITVILHGFGMRLADGVQARYQASRHRRSRTTPHPFLVVAIVAIMLATHYLEVCSWAAFYYLADMLPNYKTAMTYSINAYTTLGSSNITLHGRWQGLDGFEAMTAMLMFGWSTAILAALALESRNREE